MFLSAFSRARVARLVLVLALALVCSDSWAFCRSTTCDPRVKSCQTDESECIVEGKKLYWGGDPVEIWVDARGSSVREISADRLEDALATIYGRWTTVDCENEKPPSVSVKIAGQMEGAEANFFEEGPNRNVVTFIDEGWPHESIAIAVTTTTFDLMSGEIVDSDIELNSNLHQLALEPSSDELDAEAVLMHETGHVLGLAHSEVLGATMQPEAKGYGTSDLSSLHPDDIAGICSIYPPDRIAVESPGAPARAVTISGGGCTQSRTRSTALGWPVFATFAVGAILLLRSRAPHRNAQRPDSP